MKGRGQWRKETMLENSDHVWRGSEEEQKETMKMTMNDRKATDRQKKMGPTEDNRLTMELTEDNRATMSGWKLTGRESVSENDKSVLRMMSWFWKRRVGFQCDELVSGWQSHPLTLTAIALPPPSSSSVLCSSILLFCVVCRSIVRAGHSQPLAVY